VAKILITGAVGFIGFNCALGLVEHSDHNIVALDSFVPAYPTELTEVRGKILRDKGINLITLDLSRATESELLEKLGHVDLVLHLAAFPGVRITKSQEENVYRNNSLSFANVASYASKTCTPLIYASSSSVYGDSALISACQESELGLFVGKGAYSRSKWENEQRAFKMLSSKELRSIGLRLFSVFGPFGREDMAYFKFAKAFMADEPINVFGSLNDLRDYTPIKLVVDDILQLIELFLLDAKVIEDEFFSSNSVPILNIGSGHPRSLSEIVETYEGYFGKKSVIIQQPRIAIESRKTWSDNQKRNRILGVRDSLDFEASLISFLHWLEEYRENSSNV
jgi:UDP-glucuronate 4-epimerase